MVKNNLPEDVEIPYPKNEFKPISIEEIFISLYEEINGEFELRSIPEGMGLDHDKLIAKSKTPTKTERSKKK